MFLANSRAGLLGLEGVPTYLYWARSLADVLAWLLLSIRRHDAAQRDVRTLDDVRTALCLIPRPS